MDLADDPERDHVAQVEHVVIRPLDRRPVVEHQQQAGKRLDQEQQKRNAAHAPAKARPQGVLLDRRGVQVQQEIADHHPDAALPVRRRGVAEDAFPELRVAETGEHQGLGARD